MKIFTIWPCTEENLLIPALIIHFKLVKDKAEFSCSATVADADLKGTELPDER